MKVNIVSETPYFPKGQGVHTAFLNTVQMLRHQHVHVLINSLKKADINHFHTLGPFALYKLATSHNKVISAHIVPDSLVGSLRGYRYWGKLSTRYLVSYYNSADLVLAVAPKVKIELKKIGVKKRIEVFPNPINTSLFKKDKILREEGRKRFGIAKDAVVIIGSGQVQPRKGIEDFMHVAKSFPEYTFLWVGGKPFSALTEYSKELDYFQDNPLPNTRITGIVPYHDMPYYFNAADIFLFPSFQENAPMAVIEAAACGLPLLLRNLEEYKLLYHEGYLGGQDEKDFENYIKKLVNDKDYYAQMSKRALDLSSQFTFNKLGNKLVELYQSVIDQNT